MLSRGADIDEEVQFMDGNAYSKYRELQDRKRANEIFNDLNGSGDAGLHSQAPYILTGLQEND